jgi:hypothetical protein
MVAPVSLTAAQRAQFVQGVARGLSVHAAASACGLSVTPFVRLRRADRAFAAAIEDARRELREARAARAVVRHREKERERRAARPAKAKAPKAPRPAPATRDTRGAHPPDVMRAAVVAAAAAARAVLEGASRDARRVPHPASWGPLRGLVHQLCELADRDAAVLLLVAEVEQRAQVEQGARLSGVVADLHVDRKASARAGAR